MAGLVTLEGTDLKNFGVFAIRGSYNDFMKLPTFKEASSYSWANESNEDVDLRSREVQASDVTINFLMSANTIEALNMYRYGLLYMLQQDGWLTLYIDTLKTSFQVYYKGCDSAQFINGDKKRIKLALKFRMKNALVDW
jgi:hypothetical protein